MDIIYLAFSWLAKANLAAFSCNLANLFSYLETFFRVGLMNFPFMSLTEMVSSLIWRSRRMTSRCRKNISASSLYHLSKLADLLQIVNGCIFDVSLGSTTLSNDTESFLGFALLLLLQLLSGLLAEKSTELLLTLGGHKSLLLGHDESVLGSLCHNLLLIAQPGEISHV